MVELKKCPKVGNNKYKNLIYSTDLTEIEII